MAVPFRQQRSPDQNGFAAHLHTPVLGARPRRPPAPNEAAQWLLLACWGGARLRGLGLACLRPKVRSTSNMTGLACAPPLQPTAGAQALPPTANGAQVNQWLVTQSRAGKKECARGEGPFFSSGRARE